MALSCEVCGKPLERGKRGPVRRFCSPAHAAEGRKVIPLEPGSGEVSRAAQRVASEARKRRDVDALDDALLTALVAVGAALDKSPGSAALVSEFRGLIRDLRLEHPGQTARDLDGLLRDYRASVGTPA